MSRTCAIDPPELLSVVDDPGLDGIASDVRECFEPVLSRVG